MLAFLMPETCRLCGETLPYGVHGICPMCAAGLHRTGYQNDSGNRMVQRFAGRFPFAWASAHFYYSPDAPLAFLIQDFKYRSMPRLARRLGGIMGKELLAAGLMDDVDEIMPVPLHWSRLMRRGYNQSAEIARGVAEAAGCCVSGDLRAVRRHRSQTRVSREQRLRNAEGVFRLIHPERHDGRHIVVLDDVCTTGSTMSAAALAILSAAPGARISLLALAIAGE